MIVVDASVWVALLFQRDIFHPQSRAWFDAYSYLNTRVIAPSLVLSEVAAGLSRRTNDAMIGRASIQYLLSLSNLDIVSINHRLAKTAAEVAADYRLRGADAVYVALALTLDVPLVTWDSEQMNRVQNVVKTGIPGNL
jgi:predicted nucleic acid-binding protein